MIAAILLADGLAFVVGTALWVYARRHRDRQPTISIARVVDKHERQRLAFRKQLVQMRDRR